MSWRAKNRRRRERSRYAWLGVQTTSSSFAVPDPVRSLMTTPDMLDSDALRRCANRPRDCCRGLDAGQVDAGPQAKLLEVPRPLPARPRGRPGAGTRPAGDRRGGVAWRKRALRGI